jgi:outer membrane protein assembly factor BamE (lipoprotein component of BamABCDE complex)
MTRLRLPRPALAALLTLALLPACSVVEAQKTVRGNRVDPDELKELVVGTSTRNDVQSLLGSPTAKGAFDDNTWIYIGQVTRPRIGRTPGVVSQDVVAVNFDQNGVLRGIKHLDKSASVPVAMVGRTTPSPGSEATFMQQLLGNVGKFSAGVPGQNANVGGSGGGLSSVQ